MIPLKDKPNAIAPDSDFQFGRPKDNTGSNNGTPVNAAVFNDIFQFVEKLVNSSNVIPNGQLENTTNGYQIFDALRDVIRQGLRARLFQADLNDLIRTGLYFTTTGVNRPNANFGWVYNHMNDNDDPAFRNQFFLDSANNIYTRVRNSNVWSDWVQFASKAYVDGLFAQVNDGAYSSSATVNGGGVVQTLSIPTVSNTRMIIEIDLVAFKVSGPASNGCSLKVIGSVVNNAGIVSIINTNTMYSNTSSASDPVLTIVADGANISIRATAGSGTSYTVKTRAQLTATAAL